MIEVGIPFSDPIADGPVIQAAAQRALGAGVRVGDCFDLIAAFRARHPDVPVGILTYANIVVARPGFMRDAAAGGRRQPADRRRAGARGRAVRRAKWTQAGIEPVLIAAANTPDATLSRASRACRKPTPIASAAPGSPAPTPAVSSTRGLIDETARSRRAAARVRLRHFDARACRAAALERARRRHLRLGDRRIRRPVAKMLRDLVRSLKAATRERLGAAMN